MRHRGFEAIFIKSVAVFLLKVCQGNGCDIAHHEHLSCLRLTPISEHGIRRNRILKVCNQRTMRLKRNGGKCKGLALFEASGRERCGGDSKCKHRGQKWDRREDNPCCYSEICYRKKRSTNNLNSITLNLNSITLNFDCLLLYFSSFVLPIFLWLNHHP